MAIVGQGVGNLSSVISEGDPRGRWSSAGHLNSPAKHGVGTLEMTRSALPVAAVILLAGALPQPSWGKPTAARPNIVLILSDDMGFSDLGCYGGEINTPNLDRLAAGGLRFTQFYNTGRCCPTRASLLTGLYPHQTGVGWMMTDWEHPGYRGDLNRECLTIAEVLQQAGYKTYMAGKWHVTRHTSPQGPKHNWPLQRGFHRFYGTITGAGSFYDPGTLTRDNTQISPYADPEYQPETYYYTHAITDHAVKFLAEHHQQTPHTPFFLYVAHTAAHWPMHALPKDIAKYQGRYDGGYQPIRHARFQRMQQLGLIRPQWQLTPQAERWDRVKHTAWEARCMEVYAAMVDSLDQGVGRIIDQLQADGRLENTLILFLQDNGGCAETLGRSQRGKFTTRPAKPPFEAMKPTDLQPAVVPKQTRDGFPMLGGPGALPGPDGTYIAYGRGWANVSNTPFREYKHWVHEGGIATPLIAHWPLGLERAGELEHQPAHLIDIMATCVEVAQAEYPKTYQKHTIQPLEGRSLRTIFQGGKIQRDALYWEHEGNRAVRVGRWKLVAKGASGPWELYDMQTDRSEMHNLAAEQPERVEELAAKWQAWAKRARVLPLQPGRPNKKRAEIFSKDKRFVLQAGADLPREKSPHIVGKTLSIKVQLKPPRPGQVQEPQGVLVAQGGATAGYSLYVANSALHFATRHRGQLTVISTKPGSLNAKEASLSLDGNGRVRLAIGDLAAEGQIPGPLAMPIDGLQVGQDAKGLVGKYETAFPYQGTIENVVVELGPEIQRADSHKPKR